MQLKLEHSSLKGLAEKSLQNGNLQMDLFVGLP
jgi:hypothetical protein